jgi:D-aspartate ligase
VKAFITNASEDAGLVAARSLADAGFEVFGADTRRLPPGVRSRYLAAYYAIESPDGPPREAELMRLIERVRPDVFLPIGTRGVVTAVRHRRGLAKLTAVNAVEAPGFMAAFDKLRCMVECERLAIPCASAYSADEALSVLERTSLDPLLVVKPRWDVGGASGVHYVRDGSALAPAIRFCTERFGGFLIQEFIPGGAQAMRTVLLLFGPDSRLAASFTTRKTRQWPQTGGATAASRSTVDRALLDSVLPFFEKWRWRGPAEVELKLDARDGRHKVIEINPRFPGYLRFAWHCGLDLPTLAARLALGKAGAGGELPPYRDGATYVAPTRFLWWHESSRRHGRRITFPLL